MSVELQLPDLPPIRLGEAAAFVPPRMAWHLRLRQTVTAYLPLLLMALLALATWWLVEHTPIPAAPRAAMLAGGMPDYTMNRFTLERYAPDGRLEVRLEGRALRHFQLEDRTEIDELRLHAWAPDGRLTSATARRAVSLREASEVELRGGAEVVGETAAGKPVQIRSEFLRALLDRQIVTTTLPVQVTHGTSRVAAAGLTYDARRDVLDFKGPVRATLSPARR